MNTKPAAIASVCRGGEPRSLPGRPEPRRASRDRDPASRKLSGQRGRTTPRLDRERFVQKYQEMHRLVREAHGGMVLYIGAENWPFPIPLVSRNGAWRFDPDAGVPEIRYRRIGENELAGSGHRLAAIAYPAAYRSSGVMTFIVDADGAYQKDLGPKTVKIAGTMVEYRIDRTWTATEATL